MRQHTDATKAQVLEHRASGLSYILWTGPFEALGHRLPLADLPGICW